MGHRNDLFIMFILGGLCFTGINMMTYDIIPNTYYESLYGVYGYIRGTTNMDFNGMIEEDARIKMYSEYVYNVSSTDCKYWSNQWEEFAEEYDYGYKYVNVPNHVFGILYTNESYCLVDQRTIIC